MNTYTKNLHESVAAILEYQALALARAQAQKNVAEFSQYYAAGAQIMAANHLEILNKEYNSKQKIQKEITSIDSDANTIQHASITVEEEVARAVSNTAQAAANIQVATNAIVKLASDIGSISSIITASDIGTEIYELSEKANTLLSATAYLAETTSLHGMETSALTAQIPAAALLDKAIAAKTSIKEISNAVTSQFNTITQVISSGNEALNSASIAQRKAEESLAKDSMASAAAQVGYTFMNDVLNLNLRVTIPDGASDTLGYTVLFDSYEKPFKEHLPSDAVSPVDAYYVMLVKHTKKEIFDNSSAEAIVNNGNSNQYLKIEPADLSKEGLHIPASKLEDSDGNKMILGEDYVVFVLAILKDTYKKEINTYENYLTASSLVFSVPHQINAPKSDAITISDTTNKTTQEVTFNVAQEPLCKLIYSCMFIPDKKKPDFLFNTSLAEHVPAGCYTVVDDITYTGKGKKTIATGKMTFKPETTDNYGNPLLNGDHYIPVILVVVDDTEEKNKQFKNALSDFSNTASFCYNG